MELVHKFGRFAVSKGGDGISKAGVGAGERLGGTSLATGMVAEEGSTCSGGGTRVDDLVEVKWSAKVDGGGILRKLRVVGSEDRMWKPSRRIRLSFRRPG